MTENFRAKLILKIKKKESDNWILRILKNCLSLILLPFLIVFGLTIMLFALMISVFQTQEKVDSPANKLTEELWTVLTEVNGVRIWKRYRGDIRFGPIYYDIKTDPVIPGIENKVFGDWLYQYEQGIFLQQWNSINKPNTALVYLDCKDKKLKVIKDSINSVLWQLVKRADKILELTCDTGDGILKYEVRLQS